MIRSLQFMFCCIVVATVSSSTWAQSSSQQMSAKGERTDYVSDASFWVASYAPEFGKNKPEEMVAAANAFLKTLDDKQLAKVKHKIDSPERRLWTNLPVRAKDGGLRLGAMNQKQVEAVCDLTAGILSQQGYEKVINVMIADDQLLKNGQPRMGFGAENFAFVIFGTPDEVKPWAVQIDGHHVGINVSINADAVTISPSFIGTQPHAFKIGSKTFRPLKSETEGAYALLNSLSDEQTMKAIQGARRGRITSGPGKDGFVPTAKGVSCSTFDDKQKELLFSLIEQWVLDLPKPQADSRMEELKSEVDKMTFAWNGQTKSRSDISYHIQGPSLMIEYACQDLGGDPLDHLHTMYRDLTNEYGGQLEKASR